MKRTNMVKYMTQIYQESKRGGNSEMSDEERMNYLLAYIQDAGMLPPLNENNYHHMDNDDRRIVNCAKLCYHWENE